MAKPVRKERSQESVQVSDVKLSTDDREAIRSLDMGIKWAPLIIVIRLLVEG